MKIGVPKETAPGELRVALTPKEAGRLAASGLEVLVEAGAGHDSFPDAAYREAKAQIAKGPKEPFGAEVVLKVRKPSEPEVALLRSGGALIGFLQPLTSHELVEKLAARGVLSFSLDAIPRITRAQSMDALSSQATIAGYKAVLIAAGSLGKIFPMLMTAAGTLKPARVFVLGAGVAGLQAIATARRLGGQVEAFDVRAAAREEVHSLGARFVELPLETQEEIPVRRREGRAMTVHGHSLRRVGRGLAKESNGIACPCLPWHGNAPSWIDGRRISASRC